MTQTAEAIAAVEIKREEGCHLHAYPDARSPLGRALVKRHGASILDRIGHGRATVDEDLAQLSGHPWTIGHGYAGDGRGVKPGTVWTQERADQQLLQSLALWSVKVNNTWPGAIRLHPKARAALISCAYNRGTSLTKRASDPMDRRREMRDMQEAVSHRDYRQMAQLFRSMKRIWEGRGLSGLLRRREREAELCEQAHAETSTNETPGQAVRRLLREG